MTSGMWESSLSLTSCTRQVKSHLIVVTPAGHFGNYTGGRFAAALYSHLRECGGADPGRRCEGSPCLSHCSLSVHEFPLDCPKPAILLLYTHGCIHSYTQIQTKLQVHQALPENVWCKHLTWKTTHTTLHRHKQAKEDYKLKRKKTKTLHNNRRRTLRTTHKHIHIQTIEPQVPAASPTHAAKPEKQQYMVSIQRQKKDYFTSKSVSMIVQLAIQPRKMERMCWNMEEKNPILCTLNMFWQNGCVAQKKSPKLALVPNISYSSLTNVLKVCNTVCKTH